ncbi:hypothetical protein DL96DRAFT_1611334 [Flagelloscypha sp. PMI_526]|nr:hypothetical protein DL96DRAFT_1611334 [Flagelloscypha sp. PMI_526]
MAPTVSLANKERALHAIRIAEIEVDRRRREIEDVLEQQTEQFRDRQFDQINWIPKQVRQMTMREFSEKYKGNIQAAASAALPSTQKAPASGRETPAEIDKSKKRKWIATVEAGLPESSRATKTARIDSPKKAGSSTGPGTAQRARLKSLSRASNQSGIARTMSMLPGSPSPTKWKPSFNSYSRPTSPVKQMPHLQKSNTVASFSPSSARPPIPSAATFNLAMPSKAPIYPTTRYAQTADPLHTRQRTQSTILIRKDSSTISGDPSSSQDVTDPSSSQTPTEPTSSQSSSHSLPLQPSGHGLGLRTPVSRTTSFTGMVTIPMKDGGQMEFDPFRTSPGALDALEGVTDSAKKHARDEMSKLIHAAMNKWHVTGNS